MTISFDRYMKWNLYYIYIDIIWKYIATMKEERILVDNNRARLYIKNDCIYHTNHESRTHSFEFLLLQNISLLYQRIFLYTYKYT